MYRQLGRHWFCIASIVTLLATLAPVHAQDGGFRETFDDPALSGWEHPPEVQVVDGVLRVPSGGFAFLLGHKWGELNLTLRARRLGDGYLAVHYSASDAGAYVFVFGDEFVSLIRDVAGSTTELASAPIPTPAEQWVQVSITLFGGVHTLVLDGQTVLTVTDPQPLPPGSMLLRADGGAIGEFDDLVVSPAGEMLPSVPPQATGVPAYQAGSWAWLGGPPGGIGYDIRMRPDNPDLMYVTDVAAGVSVSTDAGQTWFPSNQGITPDMTGAIPVFCLTIDPHDYDTIWVGTYLTGHIYRSTDGGQTWEQRDNGILYDDGQGARSIRGITVDPLDPNVIYAGVEISTPGTATPGVGNTRGEVYKSTDAGQNWTQVWLGDNLARYVWVDPRHTRRVYVSTGIFDRVPVNADLEHDVWGGVGILRSDDAGESWTVLPETEGWYVPSLFMHPNDPDTILAAVTDPPGVGGVYVTRNGGDHWELILPAPLGADAVEIATDETDVWYAASEDIVWRSDDAGQTWQQFRMGTVDRNAGLPIDLQVDPRDPYRIFVNNYAGGNMVSTDGGASWVDASRGYTGAHIGGIAVLPGSNSTVIVGSNTGSFRSTDGGQTWTGVSLYRMESVVTYFPDPASAAPYIIAGDNGGRVWHSRDGGLTWEAVRVLDLMAEFQAGRIESDHHILRALAVAPSDAGVMYAGFAYYECVRSGWYYATVPTAGFFRSGDGGYTWEHAAAPFEGVAILGIAIDPQDSRTFYVGTAAGLYLSHDGGDSWQHLDTLDTVVIPVTRDRDSFPAPVMVYDVALDAANPPTVYAATAQAGVFLSKDGGMTWTQAAAGMDPNEPIYDLILDPNRPGVLYASSWLSGVFVSTDGAQSWQRLGTGLSYTSARQLALSADGTVLYAGTRGGGPFRLGTP